MLVEQPHLELGRLELVADRARDYARAARAENTKRAYRAAWADFSSWCEASGLQALPATPSTIAMYLGAQADAGLKAATIALRLSAISEAHKTAKLGEPARSPEVHVVMSGIRRTIGTAQIGKAPTLIEDIRAILGKMAPPRRGEAWRMVDLRDRAILLIGFASAFRRSELVALNVDDLDISRAGLIVLQRRSKTDQEGQGRRVGIPYGSRTATCPVRALQAWLNAADIHAGPVFRPVNRHGQVLAQRLTAQSIALVVKRRAEAADMDPDRLGGHSLRAGLATSAAAAGASERTIMAQTGHRSVTMVRRYIRSGELWKENAAAVVGL